ncbi:PLP-dependent aminotransferase family protein [Dermacoccus nishinomiyaensis]|uniref:aminotransferase-like domain-containing protein n=1 Tax=Dermacoccus nishinomiyaensis TaxID=1274 RepID=UPI0030B99FBF
MPVALLSIFMINSSSAQRIADELATEIEQLVPGAKLPPQRTLVARYAASATTIAHALTLLVQRGLVETRPGSGAFRATPRPSLSGGDTTWQEASLELTDHLESTRPGERGHWAGALSDTLIQPAVDVVDLNGGYLHPNLRPSELLTTTLSRVAKQTRAWDRPPIGGITGLRDWFAQDIAAGLGLNDILITAGGQAALATTLRAVTQPGDPIIVESPTYPGTLAAAHAAGLRLVPLPMDAQGLQPDHLDEALSRSRARLIVVQPLYQNPTGATMSPTRRTQLREIARSHHAFIVEDDFARYLLHADAPPPPAPLIADDEDGTTIHIRSLTKPTSPNLRIAAIASRGPVTARLRDALTTDSLLVPAVLQYSAVDIVTSPGWRRSQHTLAQELAHRRDLAIAILTRHFGSDALHSHPTGGYHLWFTPPAPHDGISFAQAATTAGVAVTPGANYYPLGHSTPSHVRISYVAAPNEAELERGLIRLTRLKQGV